MDERAARALSIRQPWITLLIEGHKRYEYRSWSTTYRGPLLLHAARTYSPDGPTGYEDAPRGCLLAMCILNDIGRGGERYTWDLRDITPLEHPIPILGRQGLFAVSRDTLAQLDAESPAWRDLVASFDGI